MVVTFAGFLCRNELIQCSQGTFWLLRNTTGLDAWVQNQGLLGGQVPLRSHPDQMLVYVQENKSRVSVWAEFD